MDIWVQNHSKLLLLKKGHVVIFDKYFSRSNYMIKYKTYISTTGRSFIFYFISTEDIIMLIVASFFFELAQRAYFCFNLGLEGCCEFHGVSELKLLFYMMLRLHVPLFR